MAIVKSMVEQMGGTITVTSREGEGSCFVIILPFEIAPPPEQPVRPAPAEDSIRGLHLLLAEGNELNAEIAEMLLRDEGAEELIAMTANAFQEDAQECLRAGMNALLSKPLDMDKLVRTLSALCRGGALRQIRSKHPKDPRLRGSFAFSAGEEP